MGLQGTIETFPLTDVMALIATSNKSGRLTVTSDKLVGVIWFDDGQVFRADLGDQDDIVLTEAFVALLRLGSGSFRFDQGQAAGDDVSSFDVEALLDEVADQLSEYERLEELIPHMQVSVRLIEELEDEEVLLSAAEWRIVTALHRVLRAEDLLAATSFSELEIMQLIDALDSKGVIAVLVDEPEITSPVTSRSRIEENEEEEPTATFMDLAAVVDRLDPAEPSVTANREPDRRSRSEHFFDHEPTVELDEADIAAQLASLSPSAAKAVARAASASTSEEREEALNEVEAEGSIDRDVLMRFLGTLE